MQRAVRAVSNRLIVSASASRTDGSPSVDGAEARALVTEDVQEAIRQSTPAPWMVPPCQRASQTLGAYSKFVA